jgi:hypothetical protein
MLWATSDSAVAKTEVALEYLPLVRDVGMLATRSSRAQQYFIDSSWFTSTRALIIRLSPTV